MISFTSHSFALPGCQPILRRYTERLKKINFNSITDVPILDLFRIFLISTLDTPRKLHTLSIGRIYVRSLSSGVYIKNNNNFLIIFIPSSSTYMCIFSPYTGYSSPERLQCHHSFVAYRNSPNRICANR